ncbi:MAG: CDP-alcohol phosphatidyltransferase family protein [Steroidobacteraceae bacterium]
MRHLRHLPNLICLLRIALVWPVAAAIIRGRYPLALLLFFVAAVSDALDGYLAKHFHWTSDLGRILDPAADKLLLITVFLVATWYGLIPHALTGVAVARDVMIGLGAIIYHFGWGPLNGRPMLSSKINTLLQVLYVCAVVAHAGFGLPSDAVLDALGVLMLVTILVSGYRYALVFTQRALAVARA